MTAVPLIRIFPVRWLLKPAKTTTQLLRGAFVSLVFSVGLSGCTTSEGAVAVTGARTVDASQSLALPAPGGPAIVSVIEQRYSNAVKQQVILSTSAATPGQNMIDVRMFGPMEWARGGEKRLPYRSALASDISREIRGAVPGVRMHMSGLFLRNNYGPFAYAYGESASGDSCIYGWQQLRADESERSSFRNSGAIQVRLRLCESGSSEKALLSVMYGYTLTGSFASEQWNPYGRPNGVDPSIGADGSPIYPKESELSAGAEVPRPRARAPRATNNDAIVQEDETAAKQIVDVPAPTGADAEEDTPDAATGAKVIVPGPGCENGNAQCN
jgi:hypothetical protein